MWKTPPQPLDTCCILLNILNSYHFSVGCLFLNWPVYHTVQTALSQMHWLCYWHCNTQLDNLIRLPSDVLFCDTSWTLQTAQRRWHVVLGLHDNDTKHPIFTFISKQLLNLRGSGIYESNPRRWNNFIICLLKSIFLKNKYLDSSCRLQNILLFLSSFGQTDLIFLLLCFYFSKAILFPF